MIILLKDLTWNCKIDYPKITGMRILDSFQKYLHALTQLQALREGAHIVKNPAGGTVPANLPIWLIVTNLPLHSGPN